MRRLIAATLLSTTLTMSGFTAVLAEDTEAGGASEPAASPTASNEDSDINSRAKRAHKRLAFGKHLKKKLVSKDIAKNKDDGTEADNKSAQTAEKQATESTSTATAESTTTTATTESTKANESTATNNESSKDSGTKNTIKKHRFAALKSKKTRLADTTPSTGGNATPASSGKAATKSSTNLPERLASALVGTIVGTPVNIFKKTVTETVVATKDLVGDTDNWFLLAPAGSFGIVAGVLSGTLQAPVVAGYRAWKNSADEPFGADSMSLGGGK